MKTVFSLVMALFISLAAVESAEAKRFGSGGFGKAFKTSPFKKASPQKATPGKNTGSGSALTNRKPGMGGLMGGLLAGGMFAYLLGSGAFEGIQMMDVLLMALFAFVIFKLFFARKVSHAHGQQAFGGQHSATHQAFDAFNTQSGQTDQIPMEFPANFDAAGFAQRALGHYKLVHDAWDKGQLDTIKEYLHKSLFDQLAQERSQYSGELHHQVLDLSADIVRSESTTDGHAISVLFRGRVNDVINNQEQGIYDVWHLAQTSDGAWVIVGIEAE